MSNFYDQTPCPKCGYASSDPDTCDACGALISKVRDRQQAEHNATETSSIDLGPSKFDSDIPRNRPSLTQIAVLILLLAAGGFYFLKSNTPTPKPREEVASKPKRSILFKNSSTAAPAEKRASPTPVADEAKKEPEGKIDAQNSSQAKEVFGFIANAFKGQQENAEPTAAEADTMPSFNAARKVVTATQPSAAALPTATPHITAPAPVSTPVAVAAANSQQADPLAPITLGEADFRSGGFSTAESKPADAAEPTPAGMVKKPSSPSPAPKLPAAPIVPAVAMVDTETFNSEVLRHSGTPVLVDFYATWCGPCKRLAPNLEELARNHDGKLKVVKLDVDQNENLVKKFKVDAFPTLVLFRNGREIRRMVGGMSYPDLKAQVDLFL